MYFKKNTFNASGGKLLLIGLLFASLVNVFANADSLRNVLKKSKDGNVLVLAALADSYMETHPDSAIAISERGIKLAKKISTNQGLAECYLQLAQGYMRKDNFAMSLRYDSLALYYFKKDNNRKGQASALNNLGTARIYMGKPDMALEYLNKSLALRRTIGDLKGQADCYNNLGNIYTDLGQYSKSLDYHLKSLEIREDMKDARMVSRSLGNLGNVYYFVRSYEKAIYYFSKSFGIAKKNNDYKVMELSLLNLGNCYLQKKETTKAKDFYLQALEIANSLNDTYHIGVLSGNLANIYLELGSLDNAEEYYKKGLAIGKEIQDTEGEVACMNGIGSVYGNKGKKREAIEILKQSYKIAIEAGLLYRAREASKNLSDIYFTLKDLENAYHFQKLYASYKDSLLDDETSSKLKEMSFNYELKNREKEIVTLNRQKVMQEEITKKQQYIMTLLLIAFVMCTVVIYALIVNNKKQLSAFHTIAKHKKEMEKQALELERLNAVKDKMFSVIAHDVRSPIASLRQTLTLIDKNLLDADKLRDVSTHINKQLLNVENLLNNLLHWSVSQIEGDDSVKVERVDIFGKVNRSIELFKSQYAKKEIVIRNLVSENTFALGDPDQVDLIIRNLLNNAVKFSNRGGIVTVKATEEEDYLHIAIEDEGVGMSQDKIKSILNGTETESDVGTMGEKGTGIGLVLVKEFIEKNKGTLMVASREGEGTTFTFSLPKDKEEA